MRATLCLAHRAPAALGPPARAAAARPAIGTPSAGRRVLRTSTRRGQLAEGCALERRAGWGWLGGGVKAPHCHCACRIKSHSRFRGCPAGLASAAPPPPAALLRVPSAQHARAAAALCQGDSADSEWLQHHVPKPRAQQLAGCFRLAATCLSSLPPEQMPAAPRCTATPALATPLACAAACSNGAGSTWMRRTTMSAQLSTWPP